MDQKQKDLIEEEDNDFFQLNQRYFYVMNSPQQIFQKLDGFVTLGNLDLEEENELNNIQIEQPEIKDFHLNKFFSEEKREQVNQKPTQEVQYEHRLRPLLRGSQILSSNNQFSHNQILLMKNNAKLGQQKNLIFYKKPSIRPKMVR